MAEQFSLLLVAVFCANMLTATVIWGLVTYSRHEREGTAGSKGSNAPALAAIVPLAFMGAVLYSLFY